MVGDTGDTAFGETESGATGDTERGATGDGGGSVEMVGSSLMMGEPINSSNESVGSMEGLFDRRGEVD